MRVSRSVGCAAAGRGTARLRRECGDRSSGSERRAPSSNAAAIAARSAAADADPERLGDREAEGLVDARDDLVMNGRCRLDGRRDGGQDRRAKVARRRSAC